MALAPEIQTYVDSLKFKSDDAKKAFVTLLEDPETAESAFMMQQDYTKKTQQTAADRKALDDAKKAFEDEQNYLLSTTAKWKEDLEGRLNIALKAAADSDLRGAALTSKVRALASQYGEDPDELLKDIQSKRADEGDDKSKSTPAFDRSAFEKEFVSQKKFDEVSNVALSFPAMIRDFERDYKKKFGQEYDGSITDLVREAGQQVEQQRARGRNIDLFGYMKEKLDFAGQDARNVEAAKVAADAERTKWEEEKTKEIETNLRSQLLADNPTALRKPDESEKWRESLDSKSRQNNTVRTQQDDFNRRKELHAVFEKNMERVTGAA